MDNLSFSGEWSSDAARFGLADTIGEAVQDYYDLLFDNVHEFITMNRDELREYEAEDAQLREKLEDRSIDGAERKALEESREKNREETERLREFLSGSRVIETGIRFSVEMEDDNEPELTDRFNAAPVAEKYACLVKHYMEEYRADAGFDSLAAIDAFRFGTEKVREFFPEITEQYAEHKQAEYRELLDTDPVRLQSDLVVKYSTEYVADAGRKLAEMENDRDALQWRLLEHEDAKPGWLRNLATLGQAGKDWETTREALGRQVAGHEEQMAELQKLREDCREGWLSEPAREYAKGVIASRHPDLVEACERHMARHWERKNEERLEKQEERRGGRDGDAGKTVDDGHSRNR